MTMKPALLACTMLAAITPSLAVARSASVYRTAPPDARAVMVHGAGDGRADDSAALQQAIDQAAAKDGGGIVFVPSGRYRITRSILLRSGVRVFGVGKTRPVIVLADDTPGFGSGIAAMVAFTGEDQFRSGKPAVPPRTTVPFDPTIFDATQTTFYSALANVNFAIGRGNAGAVAVRFRVAQHGYLRHIDFHMGSGFAGVYQVGNACQDLHFYGGRYGIVTEKTAPMWPFTLLDTTFDGQRDAAIREHEAGLTLVNVSIRDTPVGIEIDRGYSDSLWGKDVRFDRVSNAAVLISNEANVHTQIGFDNAVARATPVFARLRESGTIVAGKGATYRVRDFSYGLKLAALGQTGYYATMADIAPLARTPAAPPPAIRPLPPVKEWANARDFGVRGDGEADDTAALQQAIDRHRVLYLPSGRYRISDTITLRPDSVLIALHPARTRLFLRDGEAAYAGIGGPKALLQSAKGGDAIVSGLGLWAASINPRASALVWKAGAASLVDDVKIEGPALRDGTLAIPPNDPRVEPDGQQASIWVTDGGGGTFSGIWSPNTLASAGFRVSNTTTQGHVYELSAEHHYRHEIVLENVANWEFLGPQTEQEVRDGVNAISTEFHDTRNVLFANYHSYRVTRTAKPMNTALRMFNSGDIRFRNVLVNAESGFASCDDKGCGTFSRASKYPFENAITDVTRQQQVRERNFARLDVAAAGAAATASGVAATQGIEKLADGFYSIAGAAVDAAGELYFIDRFYNRIHRWSRAGGLQTVTDLPLDPVSLAVDRSGHLLVLSSAGHDGTVYSIDPAQPAAVQVIAPVATTTVAGATTLLPGNVWANGEFNDRIDPRTYTYPTLDDFFTTKMGEAKARQYVSPDRSLVLPAFRVWNQGPDDQQGWRWSDPLDAYGLVGATAGQRVVLTNASEDRTYSGLVGANGALSDLRIIAPRGGESAVRGADGRLYVADGQVFVYGADGKEVRRIDTPERPLQLVLGGPDRRTLFILTHHALYAIRV
jgi:sugar lactone lactonase YvrE